MKKWIVVHRIFAIVHYGCVWPGCTRSSKFRSASLSLTFTPTSAQLTSFNIFGGGGGFVYNVTPWIGVKADFAGYTQGSGLKNQLTSLGYAGPGERQRIHLYVRPPDQEALRETAALR